MVRHTAYRLYFGTSFKRSRYADMEYVPRELFTKWCEANVTPHFPGFTVMYGNGYWKGNREGTIILEVMANGLQALEKIKSIANLYKTRFHQESVMIAVSDCTCDFV